jgi:hypothetical protein
MHRTQILLEDKQYAALKAWARRVDKSLSEVVRQAVDRLLGCDAAQGEASKLNDICGIAADPGGPSGRDHDKILYGK